jgi:hypothetical protein
MLLFLRSGAAWPDHGQRMIGKCGRRMTEQRHMFAILHRSTHREKRVRLILVILRDDWDFEWDCWLK